MKNLIFIFLLLLSLPVFAHTTIPLTCPQKLSCAEDDNVFSCVAELNKYFMGIYNSGKIKAGDYNFYQAWADYEVLMGGGHCMYSQRSSGHLRTLDVSFNRTFEIQLDNQNNTWQINGYEGVCDSLHASDCKLSVIIREDKRRGNL